MIWKEASPMRVKTIRDLGSFVRSERRAQGMTQADLAARLGVSRDWVVRLEQGHPRLEAQRVLDALVMLGATLDLAPGRPTRARVPAAKKAPSKKAAPAKAVSKTTTREASAGRKIAKTATTGQWSSAKTSSGADPFAYLTKSR